MNTKEKAKQYPPVKYKSFVEKLRGYSPTSGYARTMYRAADTIEFLLFVVRKMKKSRTAWEHKLERAEYIRLQQLALIEKLDKQIENLQVDGIHSCSRYCQRPICVIRRRIESIEAAAFDAKAALEFYEQVMAAPPKERIPVGKDHIEWLHTVVKRIASVL